AIRARAGPRVRYQRRGNQPASNGRQRLLSRLATSGTVLSAPSANSVQPTAFRVSDFLEEGRIRNDRMSALLPRGGCTSPGPLVRLMSVRYVPGRGPLRTAAGRRQRQHRSRHWQPRWTQRRQLPPYGDAPEPAQPYRQKTPLRQSLDARTRL